MLTTDYPLTAKECRIIAVADREDALDVRWHDGTESTFLYCWLRDHCRCPDCCHPHTQERIQDPLAWSLDLRSQATRVTTSGGLHITWEDAHESPFDGDWLYRYREPSTSRPRKSPVETWGAELSTRIPRFEHEAVMREDRSLLAWLRALDTFGVAVLSGCPNESLQVLRVADRIGFARPTNFGLHFDVDSKPEPVNNAYTALALPAHTDLPNWATPPGFQLLHCLAHEASGGDSVFVDGAKAVEVLGDEAPEDLELLSTLPVDFRFQDSSSDVRFRAPVVTWRDGRLSPLRHNHGILDVVRVAPEQVKPFYRAHRRFTSILARPELRVEFRLAAGELVVFDNHRVLHGRTAFDPESGKRHFQGCYVDHDPFLSRLRVLEEPA